MTDAENSVLTALARGRLVYPFLEELNMLRSAKPEQDLLPSEARRLKELEDNYAKVKVQDEWFHSAIQSGDLESARRAAEKSLDIIKEIA